MPKKKRVEEEPQPVRKTRAELLAEALDIKNNPAMPESVLPIPEATK